MFWTYIVENTFYLDELKTGVEGFALEPGEKDADRLQHVADRRHGRPRHRLLTRHLGNADFIENLFADFQGLKLPYKWSLFFFKLDYRNVRRTRHINILYVQEVVTLHKKY